MMKRLLSLFLAVTMVTSLFSLTVFAVDDSAKLEVNDSAVKAIEFTNGSNAGTINCKVTYQDGVTDGWIAIMIASVIASNYDNEDLDSMVGGTGENYAQDATAGVYYSNTINNVTPANGAEFSFTVPDTGTFGYDQDGGIELKVFYRTENKMSWAAVASTYTLPQTGKIPTAPVAPTAPTAAAATYKPNMTLKDIALVSADGEAAVVWAWDAPTTSIDATNSGSSYAAHSDAVTGFNAGTASVTITVNKATPVVNVAPTVDATEVYSGTALPTLNGGTAKHSASDATVVAGTFAWADDAPATITGSGTVSVGYKFTPDDTTNYNSIANAGSITFTIKSAESTTLTLSSTSETYNSAGVALPTVTVKDSENAVIADSKYNVAWTKAGAPVGVTSVDAAGTYTCTVTMNDADRYANPTAATFTVTALKLTAPTLTTATADSATQITVTAPAASLPTGASKVQYSKDNGATWQDNNVFTNLTAATGYTFVAKYVADDSGNYADSDASAGVAATTSDAPTYTVTLTSPTFTDLTYGDTPVGQTVTVTNTGNQDGQVINLTVSSDNFTLSKASVTLNAGAAEDVTVTPKAALDASDTPYAATLTATNENDTSNTATANLSVKVNAKELSVNWGDLTFADMQYNGKDKTDVANPSGGAPTLDNGAVPVVNYTRATSAKGDNVTVNAEITGFTGVSTTNYKLPITGLTHTGTIKVTAKNVTLDTTGITVSEKTYDETTSAVLSKDPTLTGVIAGDDVTLKVKTAASFDSANAGAGNKTVTAVYELDGTEKDNYALTDDTLTLNGQTIKQATITGEPAISIQTDADGDGKLSSGDTVEIAKGTLSVALTAANVDIQWMRGATEITGQTGMTYEITAADANAKITAVVTAKGNYTGSVASNEMEVGKISLTGTPTISGTTAVGDTLTLDVSPLNATTSATDVSNITIQWQCGGADILDATGLTYVITSADLGKDITAVVTAKADSTYTGTATSAATAIPAVAPSAPKEVQASGDGKLTVTWKAPDSDGGSAITKYKVQIDSETPVEVTMPGALTHEFTGLTNGTAYTIKVSAVNAEGESTAAAITATPKATPSGGGGGGAVSVKATFKAGANGKLVDEKGKETGSVSVELKDKLPASVPGVRANDGYKFLGWSTDGGKTFVDPARTETAKSVTYTAIFAAYDHAPYMVGRAANRFVPSGSLTRAEAATMIARLTEGFREDGGYTTDAFTDNDGGAWYAGYVAFAAANGIVDGYTDGTFQPNRNVSRAEFAAIAARYLKLDTEGRHADFQDCAGHWADGYIAALVELGAIDGYPGNTFRPDQTITRAEAAKIVNAIIGRTPDTERAESRMDGYENPFTDVRESDWFFCDVMEASVEHVSSDFHTGK